MCDVELRLNSIGRSRRRTVWLWRGEKKNPWPIHVFSRLEPQQSRLNRASFEVLGTCMGSAFICVIKRECKSMDMGDYLHNLTESSELTLTD